MTKTLNGKRVYIPKNKVMIQQLLGDEWSYKIIDFEVCVYRKIGDKYDIEISCGGEKNPRISIYVWNLKGGLYVIDQYTRITMDNIKAVCDGIVNTYKTK